MRWVAAVVAMGMVGCAAEPASDEGANSAAAASETPVTEPIPRSELPQANAFKGWKYDTQLIEKPSPDQAPKVEIACADKELYPTHPSADRKKYHVLATGHWDYFNVDGASSLCKIKGNSKDPRTGLLRCAMSDTMQYVVLSDTYEDSCGNFYRGFWNVSFMTMDENMGTLMSRGRALYEVPNAQFKGDMFDAQTYAVDSKDMLVISSLFDGDMNAITSARTRVTEAKTHRYDAATHIWEYIGPYR